MDLYIPIFILKRKKNLTEGTTMVKTLKEHSLTRALYTEYVQILPPLPLPPV